ncbi:MAG: GWxTD domain-containing protein, partial [Candidatus Aminicenantales bacterium]
PQRWLSFLLTIGLCLPVISAQKKSGPNLPEQYRLWLEEEVVYIVTPTERDVFRKLETDRERDIFIEAFWKHRDPTPGTPRNEFRDEHYQRRKYANEYFGRGTPRPGWMTDRGRIHIILGPPKNIEDYDSINGVYPVQIWSYEGDPEYGLPTGFNIIFFKKHGMGEYVLYSPVDDGPESLLADWGTGLTAEYMQESSRQLSAVQQLAKLAPNLAYQTLSLIPGERSASGTVSLASTRLLGNVFSYPQKKVEDTYAEALLKYKDVIEVDYSANYIPSDSSLYVIKDESGRFMVHYSIEPKKISVDSYGDKYSTNYELDGRVSDTNGNTVFQYMKEFPLSFSGPEIQDLGAKALAIQDLFPLVPGTYRFDLLLKNTVSKEFTTFEGTIAIPEEGALPAITPLVLGYRLEKSASPAAEFIPFQIRYGQLLTPARKTFSQKENLIVFFQILGLPPELRSSGQLKYEVLRKEAQFLSQLKKIGEYQNAPDFLEVFPLQDFPPDYYKIRVSVLDSRGAKLLAQDEDFEITAAPGIGRPLVVSKVIPVSAAEEYDYDMGLQLLNLKRNKDALVFLEKVYAKNPTQAKYALGLSQGLFIEGQYQRIKDILTPWTGEKATDLVLYFHGKSAHSLGQLDEAIADYTNYLSRFGMNLEILNLLGTAHYQKGNAAEALRAWKRSLEINPGQENIRKLVQSLEEKIRH